MRGVEDARAGGVQAHPVGTAADCAVGMTATARRTGIDHLICMVEGSDDPAAVRQNIARLDAEIAPRLPGQPAPAGYGHWHGGPVRGR